MSKYLTLFSYMLIALFLTNCASGPSSVEFTSAKTKARSERNLKDAEMYAIKALSIETHAQDAQVPYFLAGLMSLLNLCLFQNKFFGIFRTFTP